MAEPVVDPRFARTLVTPEGVDLRLSLAQGGERASAFVLDIAIMGAALIALTIVDLIAFVGMGKLFAEVLGIVWILGAFVLRVGYFVGFELGGRAATPGKRVLGLRVVARDGGPLTAAAIVTRNALRELEVFVPLSFLAYHAAESDAELWTGIAGLAWAGVFAFFPLFNRDRMRMGDVLAGTWVVRAPRRKLALPVIATRDANAPADPGFVFTAAQLDAYGAYELQTLADVLRRSDARALTAVASGIRKKIDWTAPPGDDAAFLNAYYTALCAKLEREVLFGHKRRDKNDGRKGR